MQTVPFPTDPVGKKALWESIKNIDPKFADEIAEWKKRFPGAKLVRLETKTVAYGEPPANKLKTWAIPEDLALRVANAEAKEHAAVDALEAKRKEKLRQQRAKSARGKK